MTIYNAIAYGMCIHMFMSHFYPESYDSFIINMISNMILFYSKMEMSVMKKLNDFAKYPQIEYILNKIDDFQLDNKSNIEVIKNNNSMSITCLQSVAKDKPYKFDFIIYSDYATYKETNKLYKVIYYDTPEDYNYTPCKYSFISIDLVVVKHDTLNENESDKETHYPIKLSGDKENYYIVNNKINKLILCYLLHKQHSMLYDEQDITYTLNIIDHNADMVTMSEKDELVFKEDTYEVVVYESTTYVCDNTNSVDDLLSTLVKSQSNNISDNICFSSSPDCVGAATKVCALDTARKTESGTFTPTNNVGDVNDTTENNKPVRGESIDIVENSEYIDVKVANKVSEKQTCQMQ